MRDRFIFRVLLPPFILLLLIGGLGFWQLNRYLTNQAIGDLQTAADATAIRLERELAIRATVLENTGAEIAAIKNTYITDLTTLEKNRVGCRAHYQDNFTFLNSPDGVCNVFIENSNSFGSSLQVIEDTYVNLAKELQTTETDNINQRLSAYKQFFPETLATILIDRNQQILSSAVSGETDISPEDLLEFANRAVEQPVLGEITDINKFELAIFAYPTSGGSVLAAYDINNENFINPSWQSTPIDDNQALPIIVETGERIVFPGLKNEVEFLSKTQSVSDTSSVNTDLGGVQNIVVGAPVGNSKWTVMIASPEAIVFSPQRDTQIAVIFLAGLFIIGFLWVGTYFIKKTTDNMAQLVTGAMVFGSGRLDYKLSIDAAEKEFTQLAETMNYMASRIAATEKENDARNKEFISIATHELRAPMTSIIGYLSILQENIEKKLNKQDKMLLNTAYDGTIRLRDLVNDMLDAARLEGGREEFTLKGLDISGFITDCVDSMKVVADEAKVTVTYDSKGADKVYADEGKLRIILNNFVSNAIKYNHKSGSVHISHSHHDGQLVTAVSNTGPTIPEDQQQHMFEKFFRVDTPEHRKVTGTGIGMFVTKQYIEVMNGSVWFTSRPNEKTVFYFSLPIAKNGETSKPVKTTKPQPTNSKWIMRWRKRMN